MGIGLFCVLLFCTNRPSTGSFISTDTSRCIGCGDCIRVCGSDAIRMVAQKAIIDLSKCIACKKCIEVCPVHAIQ
ncbi:MAG: 4Fe-4S binding protein [Chitinivibrionales bacterium]|nr:4Fe-4S binding protein [Chitinivibrionales bacterium]